MCEQYKAYRFYPDATGGEVVLGVDFKCHNTNPIKICIHKLQKKHISEQSGHAAVY